MPISTSAETIQSAEYSSASRRRRTSSRTSRSKNTLPATATTWTRSVIAETHRCTERNDDDGEGDARAGSQETNRSQRASAMQTGAPLHLDFHYPHRVAAQEEVQLRLGIPAGMMFGEQRHRTRPQRPESRRRIGHGPSRDRREKRAEGSLNRAGMATAVGRSEPRSKDDVGPAGIKWRQQPIDVINIMLAICVEPHDHVVALPRCIAQARTKRTANSATFGPVEPSGTQILQPGNGVIGGTVIDNENVPAPLMQRADD